jgi:hypothetical protein
VLHHSGLIANRHHDVAFGKFCHTPTVKSFAMAQLRARLEKKSKFFGLNRLERGNWPQLSAPWRAGAKSDSNRN